MVYGKRTLAIPYVAGLCTVTGTVACHAYEHFAPTV